jgi:hypothetical protein
MYINQYEESVAHHHNWLTTKMDSEGKAPVQTEKHPAGTRPLA